jgi:Predicted metal-dependent hydrolase of the TIM-barrel fold
MFFMIDFHFHAPVHDFLEYLGEFKDSTIRYFNSKIKEETLRDSLDRVESVGIKRVVLLPIDSTTFLGRRISNDYARVDDRIVPFISVDPLKPNALEEFKEAVKKYEPVGIKFHPQLQGFDPRDRRFLRLMSLVDDRGIIAVFHTGTSGVGAGERNRIDLDFGRPIYLDAVAKDFPNVKIVMAHFGWPWTEEALAIAMFRPNVYLDLSGWSPKYIPEVIWKNLPRLSNKVLFGSDFPLITPERWLLELQNVKLEPGVKELVLRINAERLIDSVK